MSTAREGGPANEKKKIIIKRKPGQQQQQPSKQPDNVSIRLLDFNIYDANATESAATDSSGDQQNEQYQHSNGYKKRMVIQMFGLNEQGETCALFVEDMNPFFYVMVPSDWTERIKKQFVIDVVKKLGFSEGLIIKEKCALVKRKKLYGFDGGKMHNFVVLYFKNLAIMNRVKNLWYISCPETNSYDLNPEGFNYNGACLKIYESNIPPLLRFFHMNEISPSGWVEFSKENATKISDEEKKTTSCTNEFVVGMQDIHAQPAKETRVPYKICSFDIEASSSHGDFPLAIKTHKKLATNIVDVCRCIQSDDGIINNELLRKMIHVAFLNTKSENEYIDGNIQRIYSKRRLSKSQIDSYFSKFITEKIKNLTVESGVNYANTIEAMFESIGKKLALSAQATAQANGGGDGGDGDSDSDGDGEEETSENDNGITMNIVEEVKKTNVKTSHIALAQVDKDMTVLQLLQSSTLSREIKITHLNSALSGVFPEVEGDKVTFIGSTFLKSGEERPYLNHCLTIDTCDSLRDVQNSEIQVCEGGERDMLLEWTNLIQREDPDIIIGYNIFGFDYNFMFHRALENDCATEFLKLSRNKDKVCGQVDPKTQKLSIEESTIVIASGQHDLQYIKMAGRLQIDMYNYLRRDYNMSSYKLDYVSGYFIGDAVTKIEHKTNELGQDVTTVYTGNTMGLDVGSYISFEETSNSTESYKGGEKFKVIRLDSATKVFEISGKEMPNMEKKVRWGLAKDDVTPQDIFRMTNEGPAERAIIAKYCIQDCNLVHHLMRKIDVLTGFIEMANICSVPISFLVFRGQGIKLTSFIAKKCSEKNTLIPVLDRRFGNESYDGAIVLPPKCDLYLDNPVACVDYSSLYPSSMISENLSHDSKVWTKEYNLDGILVCSTGETDSSGVFIYDNLPGYEYVDVEYDTYVWKHNARGKAIKTVNGKKVCRFAQPKMDGGGNGGAGGEKAIMPSILEELLEARSATRKLIPKQTDDFMKNILDKRQLGYKVTANSLYGQCGAKTSSFYEIDVAASTTATGRKLLLYAKRVVEETYGNAECHTKYGVVNTRAETVYGDTDSAFFTFNLADKDGTPIRGKQALEITIELAQQVGELASSFLKAPHSLVYEKTIMPFCLLRKKGYVGIYYETNANKGTRKSMGIVLKRRDNAPIVKDVYGGIIDILMREQDTGRAISFLKDYLRNLVSEKIPLEKLIITKSLNSNYKNPQQIAHKVLADRMGQRDSGNKPSVGDRIPFIYIHNPDKKALQGERIEHPTYIRENNIRPNYTFYITNQIMKPVQQLFALVLEKIPGFKRRQEAFKDRIELETNKIGAENREALQKKITDLRQKEVKVLLFDEFLIQANNAINKNQSIKNFFK